MKHYRTILTELCLDAIVSCPGSDETAHLCPACGVTVPKTRTLKHAQDCLALRRQLKQDALDEYEAQHD